MVSDCNVSKPAILHLTLKKKWFDMIESGKKPEEYRAITPYWIKRLIEMNDPEGDNSTIPENIIFDLNNGHDWDLVLKAYWSKVKIFDAVHFVNGGNFHPSHPSQTVMWQGLEVREGRPEWGAEPGKKYFVIKLGERTPPH